MPYSDIDRQRSAQREFIQKKKKQNPMWHRELNKRQKQKRDSIHEIVNHLKRVMGCLLCEENDPRKLQFHHVIPELKIASVSKLIGNRSKLVAVLKEIDKCVCVCTACHGSLQNSLQYINDTIRSEKWFKDWGLHEAMEWFLSHPQSRLKKGNFFEILKAVVRNSQFQDVDKFRTLMRLKP